MRDADMPTVTEINEQKLLTRLERARALVRKIEQQESRKKRQVETKMKIILGAIALQDTSLTIQLAKKTSPRDQEFLRKNGLQF